MLHIEARCRSLFDALGLSSFDAVVAFFSPPAPLQRTTVLVRPGTLAAAGQSLLHVFYKQYEYQPAAWSFVGRASKARREYENYAVFRQLGIPCAEPVAFGEQRDGFGRLRRAFIITQTIPDALPLPEFLRSPGASNEVGAGSGSGFPFPRPERMALCQQLARFTRRIHGAGFFHHDLYWRNLLVTRPSAAGPQLWWIDCPRGSFGRWSFWRRRRRIKDLACLDKAAAELCSRTERVAFMREYLHEKRLSAEGKGLIRAVLAYRRRRWPEAWKGY